MPWRGLISLMQNLRDGQATGSYVGGHAGRYSQSSVALFEGDSAAVRGVDRFGTLADGKSDTAHGGVAARRGLGILPGVLFCVLCGREICRSGVSIFGADFVWAICVFAMAGAVIGEVEDERQDAMTPRSEREEDREICFPVFFSFLPWRHGVLAFILFGGRLGDVLGLVEGDVQGDHAVAGADFGDAAELSVFHF